MADYGTTTIPIPQNVPPIMTMYVLPSGPTVTALFTYNIPAVGVYEQWYNATLRTPWPDYQQRTVVPNF